MINILNITQQFLYNTAGSQRDLMVCPLLQIRLKKLRKMKSQKVIKYNSLGPISLIQVLTANNIKNYFFNAYNYFVGSTKLVMLIPFHTTHVICNHSS